MRDIEYINKLIKRTNRKTFLMKQKIKKIKHQLDDIQDIFKSETILVGENIIKKKYSTINYIGLLNTMVMILLTFYFVHSRNNSICGSSNFIQLLIDIIMTLMLSIELYILFKIINNK